MPTWTYSKSRGPAIRAPTTTRPRGSVFSGGRSRTSRTAEAGTRARPGPSWTEPRRTEPAATHDVTSTSLPSLRAARSCSTQACRVSTSSTQGSWHPMRRDGVDARPKRGGPRNLWTLHNGREAIHIRSSPSGWRWPATELLSAASDFAHREHRVEEGRQALRERRQVDGHSAAREGRPLEEHYVLKMFEVAISGPERSLRPSNRGDPRGPLRHRPVVA